MAAQQLLKIVYALDIKFWVRWCTCKNVITLLPPFSHFYIVFENLHYILSRTELARLVMGNHFSVYSASEENPSLGCSMINRAIYIRLITRVSV